MREILKEGEYHPLTNIQDGGSVEFNISGNGEDYIDLSAYHQHAKVKIIKSDQTSYLTRNP